jgi:hypothetical protein
MPGSSNGRLFQLEPGFQHHGTGRKLRQTVEVLRDRTVRFSTQGLR